jgi:hypothetical protein
VVHGFVHKSNVLPLGRTASTAVVRRERGGLPKPPFVRWTRLGGNGTARPSSGGPHAASPPRSARSAPSLHGAAPAGAGRASLVRVHQPARGAVFPFPPAPPRSPAAAPRTGEPPETICTALARPPGLPPPRGPARSEKDGCDPPHQRPSTPPQPPPASFGRPAPGRVGMSLRLPRFEAPSAEGASEPAREAQPTSRVRCML